VNDSTARSMPLVAPAMRLPPYGYNHVRRLSIVLEADPDALRAFIPPPLEYVSNKFVVWIEHRVDQNPSPSPDWFTHPIDTYEASVDIPVRYKGETGTTIPLMWVPATEADFARTLAGRELQGIGKTMAGFVWDERLLDDEVVAKLTRNGVDVVTMHVRLNGGDFDLPTRPPVISVKTIPSIDGRGLDVHKVVALESWNVNVTARQGVDVLAFELGESDADPLYRLNPVTVHGGLFTVWQGTTDDPCGRELDDLLKGAG
jgi:acetoacetate decarboxylase